MFATVRARGRSYAGDLEAKRLVRGVYMPANETQLDAYSLKAGGVTEEMVVAAEAQLSAHWFGFVQHLRDLNADQWRVFIETSNLPFMLAKVRASARVCWLLRIRCLSHCLFLASRGASVGQEGGYEKCRRRAYATPCSSWRNASGRPCPLTQPSCTTCVRCLRVCAYACGCACVYVGVGV